MCQTLIRRRLRRLLLTAAFVIGTLGSAWPAHADDWEAVTRLRPEERIRLQLVDAAPVTGTLVSAGVDAVTVMIHGTPSVARREQVRRVERDRGVARSLPWLGLAVGAVWMGSEVAREGDFTATGCAFWTGVGAGLGGVTGAVVRRLTRFSPVYQASMQDKRVAPPVSD